MRGNESVMSFYKRDNNKRCLSPFLSRNLLSPGCGKAIAYLRLGLQIKPGTAPARFTTLFPFLLTLVPPFTPRQHSPTVLRIMPRFTLSTLVALAIVSSKVYAQNTTTTTSAITPLASKHFDYNNLVRPASRSRFRTHSLTPLALTAIPS